MSLYYNQIQTPIGTLTSVVRNEALVELLFGAATPAHATLDPARTSHVDLQLAEYFAGERTRFDLSLDAKGTPFQHRVWELLREIPYGVTVSYGQLAAKLGIAGASRAVGRANATNPIAIIVPCHRVIGSNGTLTGYAGGLGMKEQLLALERRHAHQPSLL